MLAKHLPKSATALLVLAGLAAALGMDVAAIAAPAPAAAEMGLSSVVRGGRLYDNWYAETGAKVPTQSHPAYPRDKKFAKNPDQNWRCVECHGWDYKGKDGAYSKGDHYTGIKGIRGMAGTDPEKIIAVLKGETHGYSDLMEDRDFRNLANFVSKGQVDMDGFIDRASAGGKGDKTKNQAYYNTICAACHGRVGLGVRTIPPLGKFATTNPWAALHKILNGHPKERMPPMRVFGGEVVADILAYIQALPREELISSIVRGGRLYDNWYEEIGAKAPTQSHPAYPDDKKFAKYPAQNWRCVECHGWDYKGKNGAYSKGDHYTGIRGIRRMAGADPEKIIAVLESETHAFRGLRRYRGYLDTYDLRDLANFVSKGQVDMDQFIDRATGMAKGDKSRREAYYSSICATCHGRDGLNVRTVAPLGKISKEDPWKTLHRIINGHFAKKMPGLRVLGMPALVDTLTFIQTLPTEEVLSSIVRGGRLYDNWYAETGAKVPNLPQPAYPRDKMYAGEPRKNWRCVECHGWDYRGKDGDYSKGDHYTGIKGIRGMAGAEPEKIIAVLSDANHVYDTVLDNHDLRDLANFVAKGQVDMEKYIDRASNSARGDRTKHKEYFETICANCHGADGRKMRSVMPPLGRVAKGRPWMALHKMLNGHPDEGMPALRVLETQVLIDSLAYIQSLPADN